MLKSSAGSACLQSCSPARTPCCLPVSMWGLHPEGPRVWRAVGGFIYHTQWCRGTYVVLAKARRIFQCGSKQWMNNTGRGINRRGKGRPELHQFPCPQQGQQKVQLAGPQRGAASPIILPLGFAQLSLSILSRFWHLWLLPILVALTHRSAMVTMAYLIARADVWQANSMHSKYTRRKLVESVIDLLTAMGSQPMPALGPGTLPHTLSNTAHGLIMSWPLVGPSGLTCCQFPPALSSALLNTCSLPNKLWAVSCLGLPTSCGLSAEPHHLSCG